ncbi:MAG: hypothetical protein COB90_04260, partial [Hyphomicrobiales bacterium]
EVKETQYRDPEEVHFARGFQDIFISIGLVILCAGYFSGMLTIFGSKGVTGPVAFGGLAVLSWLLAEWLSKKLRLALPSILLTGAFVYACVAMAGGTINYFYGDLTFAHAPWSPYHGSRGSIEGAQVILPFMAGIAAGMLFYKRFRVPITPAAILASVVGAALAGLFAAFPEFMEENGFFLFLIIGFGCFATAMWFDSKDRLRETLNSDKAFWLHLLAAPIIVHSARWALTENSGSNSAALMVIALVLVLGVVALIVDRRALLASALIYLGIAIGTLLDQVSVSSNGMFALTLVILGLFVLTLGSGWPVLRRIVMRPLEGTLVAGIVPPVREILKVKK